MRKILAELDENTSTPEENRETLALVLAADPRSIDRVVDALTELEVARVARRLGVDSKRTRKAQASAVKAYLAPQEVSA